MKIAFFDIKEHEIDFFKSNCPDNLEQFYFSEPITDCINLPDVVYSSEMISTFLFSKLTSDILSKFKNLKYIFSRSVGYNHIDLEYCKCKGIKIYIAAHYGDWTVAEYVFALLLSAIRNINKAVFSLKNSKVHQGDLMGLELHTKTMGIIGMGAIGERVASIANGFGMKVVAYDKNRTTGYRHLPFDKLLMTSDFISIHCPLTTETENLISDKEFALMKNTAVLINTSRGEIINQNALINALEEKKISQVCLDVLECEDVTYNLNNKNFELDCIDKKCLMNFVLNKKLLSFENVLITPHIAYNTSEAVGRILKITSSNIENCFMGKFELCLKNQVLV